MAAHGSSGELGGSAWGREGLRTWKPVPLLRPFRRNEAAHRTVKKKMGQKGGGGIKEPWAEKGEERESERKRAQEGEKNKKTQQQQKSEESKAPRQVRQNRAKLQTRTSHNKEEKLYKLNSFFFKCSL